MFRARFIISGSVQGVGYRSFVKRLAILSKVNGYVKNMLDGTVEVVAEAATKEDLDLFKSRLYKRATGFDDITVDNVATAGIEEADKPEYNSFDVRL